MQDRYVGDIGDFGKYGLLRALSGTPENGLYFSLGVVWYLTVPTDAELQNADGGLIEFLADTPEREEYRECDPLLYDTLKRLVCSQNRNVFTVRQNGILADETVYYEPIVPNRNRDKWLAGALGVTRESELVFIDPDNGIGREVESPKHASIAELRRFVERGQSLVIYQHNTHASNWINNIAKELEEGLTIERPPRVWALQWHRGQSRAYFIVAHPKHELLLNAQIVTFLKGPWGKKRERWDKPHFSLAYPSGDPTK